MAFAPLAERGSLAGEEALENLAEDLIRGAADGDRRALMRSATGQARPPCS